MPRYSSSEMMAHFIKQMLEDPEAFKAFDQMLESFQQRDATLADEPDQDEKSLAFREIVMKLESMRENMRHAAESMPPILAAPVIAQSYMTQASDNYRDVTQRLDAYLNNYPDDQHLDFFRQFQAVTSAEPVLAKEAAKDLGETKTAETWINEAKAKIGKNPPDFDLDYQIARIFAARQLAESDRGYVDKLRNKQLTEGELDLQARKLVENDLFQQFLHENGVPDFSMNADEAMIMAGGKGKTAYLQVREGHGGKFEDAFTAFLKAQRDYDLLDSSVFGRYQDTTFQEDRLTKEKKPYFTGEELPKGEKWADEDTVAYMKHQDHPQGSLGIPMKDGRYAGKPWKEDAPRIFFMEKDENGKERIRTIEEAGVEIGTAAFWQKAQRGEMFAYPAGSTDPVQVQLVVKKTGSPEITFSKPLSKETLITTPKPKEPGFFTRMFSGIVKRYGDQMRAYQDALHEREALSGKLDAMKNARKASALTERAEYAELVAKAEAAKKVLSAREHQQAFDLSQEQLLAVYGTQPKKIASLVTGVDGSRITKSFKPEVFDKLKPIDLNVSAIKVGDRTLSETDFCVLGMAAAQQTEHAYRSYLASGEGDPHFVPALMKLNYTEEEAKRIAGNTVDTNFTIDVMNASPRAGLDSTVETAIEPGRQEAAEALRQYQSGNKEPLAKLIANGINHLSEQMPAHSIGQAYSQYVHYIGTMTRLSDMAEADPELKEKAFAQGLKEQNLKAVKGIKSYHEIYRKADDANTILAQAAADGTYLGKARKQELTKDILKEEIATKTIMSQINTEEEKTHRFADACEKYDKLNASPTIGQMKDFAAKKLAPPEGKLWPTQVEHLRIGTQAQFRSIPKALMQLGTEKGMENLDQITEQIAEREKVSEKKESVLQKEISAEAYTKVDKLGKIAGFGEPDVKQHQPGIGTGQVEHAYGNEEKKEEEVQIIN